MEKSVYFSEISVQVSGLRLLSEALLEEVLVSVSVELESGSDEWAFDQDGNLS